MKQHLSLLYSKKNPIQSKELGFYLEINTS
jgi:hypothetical protein